MFESFNSGWEMVKQSYGILKKQKTLVLFPILSMLACIVVMISFIAPLFMMEDFFGKVAKGANQINNGNGKQWLWYVFGFLFYFVNYFVIVFFNVALAACAIVHFKGGEPTLGAGLKAAASRLPQITAWALVSATVGMILRAIEERAEWVGKIITGILGVVWTLATYLVVPILAVEKVGPMDAIKRSSSLLRKSWGEGLAGGFSIGILGFLLFIPGVLMMVGAGFLFQTAVPLAITIGVLGIIYLLVISIVMETLKQIYISGLYLYSSEGTVPQGFDADTIEHAFHKKKK